MIRLTRAGEYAVRAVLFLATQPSGEIIDRESVANAQSIPASFLSKILQRLTAAGIIRSYKGAAGGFCLAKPSNEISLLDVVKAIEGPLALNQCLIDVCDCENIGRCPVHPIWRQVQADIEATLSRVNFAQLSNGGAPHLNPPHPFDGT